MWVFWVNTCTAYVVTGVLKLRLSVASSARGSKVFRYGFAGDDEAGHQSALTCVWPLFTYHPGRKNGLHQRSHFLLDAEVKSG
jgi:hypothetical protein